MLFATIFHSNLPVIATSIYAFTSWSLTENHAWSSWQATQRRKNYWIVERDVSHLGESWSPKKLGPDEHPNRPTVGISRVKNVLLLFYPFLWLRDIEGLKERRILAGIVVEHMVLELFCGQAIDAVLVSVNKWIYGKHRMQQLSSLFILSHNWDRLRTSGQFTAI